MNNDRNFFIDEDNEKIEKTNNKKKNIFSQIDDTIFSSRKNTALLLFSLIFFTIIIVMIYCSVNGGFFNMATDDILQYYPFMAGFINDVKNGTVDLYNESLFGGTSFFANSYYIPLDVFTLLTLLFSYFINTESAYAFVNFLKPLFGALLLFYVLTRKGYKNRSAFIAGVIFYTCGLFEAYIVFPVYLGIMFYAPLAMLISDLFIENRKKWYWTIPLYVVVVILYDFYIAYMLMAFIFIYNIVESHITNRYSYFHKENLFIRNKEFYINVFGFFFLLILGLGMAMVYFYPNYLYITLETYRSKGSYDLWKFKKDAHYYTMFINFFIPNEPHRFMLIGRGDYVQEHATFYMTTSGLVFLINFFFLKGRENNRLKVYVLLLNIIFLFPIASMIFSGNSAPYVRWFFIPYIINLIAMTKAIDTTDFSIEKKWYNITFILITLFTGLGVLIYTYITGTNLYIHYSSTDLYFLPLIIIGLAFVVINILLIFLTITTKNKHPKLTMSIIMLEAIVAFGVVLSDSDYAINKYYKNTSDIYKVRDTLIENTAYEENQGYRVCFDYTPTKSIPNSSQIADNFSFGRFFQSFYDVNFNDVFNTFFIEKNTSWSKNYMNYYNIPFSELFNVKYVIIPKASKVDMPRVYSVAYDDGTYLYYELSDMPQFTVYDSVFLSVTNYNIINRAEILSKYGTFQCYNKENSNYKTKDEYIDYCNEKNIIISSSNTVKSNLQNHYSFYDNHSVVGQINTLEEQGNYRVYDISNITLNDVLYVFAQADDIRNKEWEDMYITDTEGVIHGMNFNTIGTDGSWQPQTLHILRNAEKDSKEIELYTFSNDAYTSYIEEQQKYTNRSYSLNGNKMSIKFDMDAVNHKRIIKTAYAYSADWRCSNPDYEVIDIDCGLLGVLVPENTTNVDIELEFVPAGIETGSKITLASSLIYAIIVVVPIYYIKKIKPKKNDTEQKEEKEN